MCLLYHIQHTACTAFDHSGFWLMKVVEEAFTCISYYLKTDTEPNTILFIQLLNIHSSTSMYKWFFEFHFANENNAVPFSVKQFKYTRCRCCQYFPHSIANYFYLHSSYVLIFCWFYTSMTWFRIWALYVSIVVVGYCPCM